MRDNKTYVTLNGIVKHRTDMAVLVYVEEAEEEVWFPLSQCDGLEDIDRGDEVEFDCPEWLADEKGLLP